MSWELRHDEVDLTESESGSGDVVSAMSAAVGRLRQLAAAAFGAGPQAVMDAEAAPTDPIG
ncbi:MAG TPA: hypothetical protein VEG38_22740 [Acidimicrobiia bacterium]|nr:hypothetical protein [Acidimicrobiia bacterium]